MEQKLKFHRNTSEERNYFRGQDMKREILIKCDLSKQQLGFNLTAEDSGIVVQGRCVSELVFRDVCASFFMA
jgi:hypothetical protein